MSYEDTKCPCGGKKEPNIMLCEECVSTFAGRPEMTIYQDTTEHLDLRRNAAQVLLALARGRKRR